MMIMMIMGIYHRGSGEPLSPQNLEWGTLMQIVPAPDFVMFRNFKDEIACSVRENVRNNSKNVKSHVFLDFQKKT